MISILIPIYNRKVTKLVETLFDQCVDLNIEFEILCYDDCSQEKYRSENRVLGQKMGVSYMDLSTNLGRSKIRNWLGKNARFEYLIFLDCDSLIERKPLSKNISNKLDRQMWFTEEQAIPREFQANPCDCIGNMEKRWKHNP